MFTSPLAETLAEDLLDRFLRYVRIDTQSRRDRTQSPSTPGQLDLARMLVAELLAIGLTDASLDDNGYVTATLPRREGAGDRADRARGHVPGRSRRGRGSDRPPGLRRRAHRAAARRHRARPGEMPLLAAARPHDRHLERRHPARRRRQGRRGRDHGRRRPPGRAPGTPAPGAAGVLHAGRGDRRGRDAVRRRRLRRRLRLHVRRLGARRAAGRDVHGRRGDADHPWRRGAPGLGEGRAGQCRPAGRPGAGRAAGRPHARAHGGPRRLHPPVRRAGLGWARGRPLDRARLRRREARGARRADPAHGRRDRRRRQGREDGVRGQAAVPEHASLHRGVPGVGEGRRGGDRRRGA